MVNTHKHYISSEVLLAAQAAVDGVIPFEDLIGQAEGKGADSYVVFSVVWPRGWEMDFNIVRGYEKPYIDVTLFQDGCEVYTWEPVDNFFENDGVWMVVLEDGSEAFRVDLVLE